MKTGAPSKFEQYKDIVVGMAKWGLTDKQMAESLGITEQTLNNWKKKDEIFFESLKSAKVEADTQVSESLFKKALGYSYNEVTQEPDEMGGMSITKIVTKQQAPDTTAQIFWLKNRQPDKWRDKHNVEHTGNIDVVTTSLINKYLEE